MGSRNLGSFFTATQRLNRPSLRSNHDSKTIHDEDTQCYLFHKHILGKMSKLRPLFFSEKALFMGLMAFRFLNAFMIQTQYVPDEYWQSLEIAHSYVFGYGYKTWEWKNGLRGFLYPSVFVVLFKFLDIFRLDYRILLIKLPRILQGVLAATGDLYLYKLSSRLSNKSVAQWTLVCQLLSWFTFYTYTRTLTNGAETALTVIALYYYPWPATKSVGQNSTIKFLLLAGISVIVRPTAAITWILMCGWHVQRQFSLRIFLQYCFAIGTCLLLSILLDFVGYGRLVLVHYNFFHFNVMSDLGAFYGSHPWYWYFLQGYPVVMAMHLLPFTFGVVKAKNKVLLVLILWTMLIYSFLSHKEFRFLLPIVPLSMYYCGIFFHSLCEHTESADNESERALASDNVRQPSGRRQVSGSGDDEHKSRLSMVYILLILLLVTNVPIALYFSLIHQRGTVTVMKYLHDEDVIRPANVLFLMPCHSTPYYSYLHRYVKMRFLTCEPNLNQDVGYVDEAEQFYNDPVRWLDAEFTQLAAHKQPTHIVYYSSLHDTLLPYLNQYNYSKCAQFFHTHFPDGRVDSEIFVSCRL